MGSGSSISAWSPHAASLMRGSESRRLAFRSRSASWITSVVMSLSGATSVRYCSAMTPITLVSKSPLDSVPFQMGKYISS